MKPHTIFLGLLVLSAIWVGTAQSVGAQGQTKITFWYTENSSEAPGVLSLIADFETANPDVDVVPEAKGFFSAKETYLTQFSAQLEPTVFRAARDWVIEFAQQGLIQPVTDFMSSEDKADFIDEAISLVTYPDANGVDQLWGWPHLVDGPALFYNKFLLDEAGIDTSVLTTNTSLTWDEFTTMAQTIWDAQLGTPDDPVYGFTMQGMFFGAQPIYYGNGARFFANDKVSFENIAIDSPESIKALELVKAVADADYTPPWSEQGWETINSMFQNGKVALIQQGPWEIATMLKNGAEFNSDIEGSPAYAGESNLGIMRLPHDENGNEGAPLGGHAFVITKRASDKVQDAAMRFGEFMSSFQANKEGAIDYFHVPTRKSVYEDVELQNSNAWKYVQTFKFIVDRSIKNPVDPRWAQLETIFGNELDNYLAEEETLTEFLAFVESFWGDILVEGGGVFQSTGAGATDTDTTPYNIYYFLAAVILVPIIRKKKLI